MKNIIRLPLIIILEILFMTGCAQTVPSDVTPFTIKKPYISLPVMIGNTKVKTQMLFDIGWGGSDITFDKTFIEVHPTILKGKKVDFTYTQQGDHKKYLQEYYSDSCKVSNDFHQWSYPRVIVIEGEKERHGFDAYGGLPGNDHENVWELNFEHNYLRVCPSDSFQIPSGSIVASLKYIQDSKRADFQKYITRLPITITLPNGTSIKYDDEWIIDTGAPYDIYLPPTVTKTANELEKYKEEASWMYNRHFWITKVQYGKSNYLDSVRVYVLNDKELPVKGMIGLNFLKHFNVFFDLKKNKLYLQPQPNFERIIQGRKEWFGERTIKRNGKTYISELPNIKANPLRNAGMQIGDQLISFDKKKDSDGYMTHIVYIREGKKCSKTVKLIPIITID